MRMRDLINRLTAIVAECPNALDWNVDVSTEDEETTHYAKLKDVDVCEATIVLEGDYE